MLNSQKEIDVFKALEQSGGMKSDHIPKAKAAASKADALAKKLKAIGELPPEPEPPTGGTTGGGTVTPPKKPPAEVIAASNAVLAVATQCEGAKAACDSVSSYIGERMKEIDSSLIIIGNGFEIGKKMKDPKVSDSSLTDAIDVLSNYSYTDAISVALGKLDSASADIGTLLNSLKPKLWQPTELVLTQKQKDDLKAFVAKLEKELPPLSAAIAGNSSLVSKSTDSWDYLKKLFETAVDASVVIAATNIPNVKGAAKALMPPALQAAIGN